MKKRPTTTGPPTKISAPKGEASFTRCEYGGDSHVHLYDATGIPLSAAPLFTLFQVEHVLRRVCTTQTVTEDDRVRLLRQLEAVKLPPGSHDDPRNALFELFERAPPPDA